MNNNNAEAADSDDGISRLHISNILILAAITYFADSEDVSLISVCYGNMIISLIMQISSVLEKICGRPGEPRSSKWNCFYITSLLYRLCCTTFDRCAQYYRFIYTVRYFRLSSAVCEKYPLSLFYLKIVTLGNVLVLCIIGIIFLGVLALLVIKCCDSCCPRFLPQTAAFHALAAHMAGALGSQDIRVVNYVLTNIQKSKFRVAVHTSYKECPICLVEFVEGMEIVELPCDKRHYFHVQCIESWISGQRMVSCPLCKRDIAEELNRRAGEEKKEEEVKVQEEPKAAPGEVVLNVGN